jgi:hypothetical protein
LERTKYWPTARFKGAVGGEAGTQLLSLKALHRRAEQSGGRVQRERKFGHASTIIVGYHFWHSRTRASEHHSIPNCCLRRMHARVSGGLAAMLAAGQGVIAAAQKGKEAVTPTSVMAAGQTAFRYSGGQTRAQRQRQLVLIRARPLSTALVQPRGVNFWKDDGTVLGQYGTRALAGRRWCGVVRQGRPGVADAAWWIDILRCSDVICAWDSEP